MNGHPTETIKTLAASAVPQYGGPDGKTRVLAFPTEMAKRPKGRVRRSRQRIWYWPPEAPGPHESVHHSQIIYEEGDTLYEYLDSEDPSPISGTLFNRVWDEARKAL